MGANVAVLSTLDTKGEEAGYLRERIEELGGAATLIDIGVVGEPGIEADVSRAEVAAAGGARLAALLESPTREAAGPVMVAGATKIVLERIAAGEVHAVLGVGGTQGTSSCTGVMRALPYGFPKLMVSTAASGDTSSFVGIKDITMMFSVSDLMGLNPFTEKILANAAAAAHGMAEAQIASSADRWERRPGGASGEGGGDQEAGGDQETRAAGKPPPPPLTETGPEPAAASKSKPLIAMTNLGVLTAGANIALDRLRDAGYDVVVFHAVGSGGRAMEQLMKDGVVGAVFDYALGEIADEVFGALRAGGPERLTVAGELGLPQVICPGGAEHLGIFVEPETVPAEYRDHKHVFHSPVIFVPRLNAEEAIRVAEEICRRLQATRGDAVFLLPLLGVSRYSIPGGPLHDPEADEAFFDALEAGLPDNVELVEVEAGAEDPEFVGQAVDRLIALLEASDDS